MRLLYEFGQCRKGSFYGFDSHVVIHFLPHEGRFSKCFGFLTDGKCVKFGYVTQMIKYISLIVAKIADRILSEMGVIKGQDFQIG